MGKRLTEKELKRLYESKAFTDEELQEIIINATPTLWCESYLNDPDHPEERLTFRDYQKNMINSIAKTKITRCGRRIGKTVALVSEAIWHPMTEKNHRTVIVAPLKENIKEIKRVLVNMAHSSDYVSRSIVKTESDPYAIYFNNNSSIICLNANKNPEKIRGKGCNRRCFRCRKCTIDDKSTM